MLTANTRNTISVVEHVIRMSMLCTIYHISDICCFRQFDFGKFSCFVSPRDGVSCQFYPTFHFLSSGYCSLKIYFSLLYQFLLSINKLDLNNTLGDSTFWTRTTS